jgi:hypothetical protein
MKTKIKRLLKSLPFAHLDLPQPIAVIHIILAVIFTSFDLVSNGIDPNKPDFIPTLFFVFFGGPLIANIIYKQLEIDFVLIGAFSAGIAIFMIIKNISWVKKLSCVAPIAGKLTLLIGLKNNDERLPNVLMWLVVSSFSGLLIRKYLFGPERVKTKTLELIYLMVDISIVVIGRWLKMPDIFVVATILTCSILSKVKKLKVQGKKIVKSEVSTPSILRTPKRMASIVVEKKEKKSSKKKSGIEEE